MKVLGNQNTHKKEVQVQENGALEKAPLVKALGELKEYAKVAEMDKVEYHFVVSLIYALQHLLEFWGELDKDVEAEDTIPEEEPNVI